MKKQLNTVFNIDANKLFGYFLNQIGVTTEFTKTKYGYRTYKSDWKFYVGMKKIIKTTTEKIFNGFEYNNVIIETAFSIVKINGKVSVKQVYKKALK